MKNKYTGALGENFAETYLKNKGHTILYRNYKCRFGEIDIISSFKNILCFTEVKTRTSIDFGLPCEAVNFYKKKKIKTAALSYLNEKKIISDMLRFDVIEIYLYKDLTLKNINLIENAF